MVRTFLVAWFVLVLVLVIYFGALGTVISNELSRIADALSVIASPVK